MKKRPSGTPRKPRAKHKKLQKAAPAMDGEQALLSLPVEPSTRAIPACAPPPKVPVSAPAKTNAPAGDDDVHPVQPEMVTEHHAPAVAPTAAPRETSAVPPHPAVVRASKTVPNRRFETASRPPKSEAVSDRPVTNPSPPQVGVRGKLAKIFSMDHITPTVGLMTLAGCLTFLITPTEDQVSDARMAAALNPGLPMVVIDPGHGGRDQGATANDLVEKELTLDLAFRTERLLQTYGFKTVLTRRDDTFVSLLDRAEFANKYERSLFVSLHFNKSEASAATGIETYYASQKVLPPQQWSWAGFFTKPEDNQNADTGENFAGYVQAALVSRTESGNRGIKPKALYVVRHTKVPAILVEGGFISNLFEARLIATPEYRDRLAAAVVDGVIQYSNTMPRPRLAPTQLAKASP